MFSPQQMFTLHLTAASWSIKFSHSRRFWTLVFSLLCRRRTQVRSTKWLWPTNSLDMVFPFPKRTGNKVLLLISRLIANSCDCQRWKVMSRIYYKKYGCIVLLLALYLIIFEDSCVFDCFVSRFVAFSSIYCRSKEHIVNFISLFRGKCKLKSHCDQLSRRASSLWFNQISRLDRLFLSAVLSFNATIINMTCQRWWQLSMSRILGV